MIARAALASCEEPFVDPNEVLQFHLRLSRETWDLVRLEKNPGLACDAQYTYQRASFRCGDTEPWIEIGVRHKRGDQRGIDAPEKPPLKLDFNRFDDSLRWPSAMGRLGFRKLTLNNGQSNLSGGVLPNLVAERVAWDLMREQAPFASRTAWAQLWVHFTDVQGNESIEYRGVYLVIEDLDRTAMRRRHGTSCGALLKTTVGRCREELEFDDGAPNDARTAYEAWFHDGAGAATDALQLDDLMRQEALRDVLGNAFDGPLGQQFNNYYRSEPRLGRSRLYPWDLDWLFAAFPLEIAPDTPLDRTCSPLGVKTRCLDSLRPTYAALACELTQSTLAPEHVLEVWNARDATIRPVLRLESDAVWAGEDPLDAALLGSYEATHQRMQSWIPQRIASVREALSCPSDCQASEQPCAVGGCVGKRTCADGAWSTCQVSSSVESCNGLDDDCDGVIDDGCSLDKEDCAKGVSTPRQNISSCGCSSLMGLAWPWIFFFRRCVRGSARRSAPR